MPITTPSTTGSSFSGPSTGPWGNQGGGGGSSSSAPKPKPVTNTAPTPTYQRFLVSCTGLKPNTLHDFYYEGVVRNKDCTPTSKGSGTAAWIASGSSNNNATFLTSDSQGKLEFAFYFTPNVEKEVDLSNKVRYELAGDKKFEVRATNSTASKIVPFKRNTRVNTSNNSTTASRNVR